MRSPGPVAALHFDSIQLGGTHAIYVNGLRPPPPLGRSDSKDGGINDVSIRAYTLLTRGELPTRAPREPQYIHPRWHSAIHQKRTSIPLHSAEDPMAPHEETCPEYPCHDMIPYETSAFWIAQISQSESE